MTSTQDFRVFVSTPYDKKTDPDKYWLSLYQEGIRPAGEIVSKNSNYALTFYNASLNPRVGTVDKIVPHELDNCRILLSVLTDYRPCVLWETGYAQKLGLPTVYMLGMKLWGEHIPITVGVPDILYYEDDRTCFGTIPSKLSEYLIKACEAADLKLRKQSEMIRGPSYNVTCYANRHALRFPEKIKEAKTRIEILTTNIDYFVNPSKLNREDQFNLEYFEEALERGVQITILTMDPDSNLVVERSKQIDPQYKDDVYRYREELRKAILKFYNKFSQQIRKGSLVLDLYNSLPTLMMYVVDDTVYVPCMAGHTRSRNCLHVEFNESWPGVALTYRTHFDLVLREAKSIEQFSWIRDAANKEGEQPDGKPAAMSVKAGA